MKRKYRKLPSYDLREEVLGAAGLAKKLSARLEGIMALRGAVDEKTYKAEIGALAIEFNVLVQRLKDLGRAS